VEIVLPEGKAAETDAAAKTEEAQPPIALGDSIMTEFMVDSAVVRYEDGASPAYPESMLRRRIEGSVIVQYVVDTLGHADTLTFRVISATHADFARAVKTTLPRMRFRPAIMANRLVPQLVQQPFAFRILDTTTAVRARPPHGDRGAPRDPASTVPGVPRIAPVHAPSRLHLDEIPGTALAIAERHQLPIGRPPVALATSEVLEELHKLCADVIRPVQRVRLAETTAKERSDDH
jgi:TonB family protein